jgi:hypothetical protein
MIDIIGPNGYNPNTIHLYREGGLWMAQFCGPHASAVVAAFGTDSIPTPFTSEHSLEPVKATVEARNPGVDVWCRHRNTSSMPGVGVIVCGDCGIRW